MGFRPALVAVGIAMTVVVLSGCSDNQSAQPAQPTHKIVRHTFYGYDPAASGMREVLSWTSQDDNGPIDGTYTVQQRKTDASPWEDTLTDPKPFQGTQHGNEISVPGEQLGLTGGDLHGTIQQNGHRLHCNTDLGIETYDLYDSPSTGSSAKSR
ncbi:hypothetical protein ACFVZR_39465 [Streptomyces sp. NPDC058316]